MTTIDCNVIWQDTSGNPISSALVGEEICILIQFESNPTSSLNDWAGYLSELPGSFVPTGWFKTGGSPSFIEPMLPLYSNFPDVAPDGATSGFWGIVGSFSFAQSLVSDYLSFSVSAEDHTVFSSSTNYETLNVTGWGGFSGVMPSGESSPPEFLLGQSIFFTDIRGGEDDSGVIIELLSMGDDLISLPVDMMGAEWPAAIATTVNDIEEWVGFSGEGSTHNFGALVADNGDVAGVVLKGLSNSVGSKSVTLEYSTGSHGTITPSLDYTVINSRLKAGTRVYAYGIDPVATPIEVNDEVSVYALVDFDHFDASITCLHVPDSFVVTNAVYGLEDYPSSWTTPWSFSGNGSSHTFTTEASGNATDVGVMLTGHFTQGGSYDFIFEGSSTYRRTTVRHQTFKVNGAGATPEVFPTSVAQWYADDNLTPISTTENGEDAVLHVGAVCIGSEVTVTVEDISPNLILNSVSVLTQHLNGTTATSSWGDFSGEGDSLTFLNLGNFDGDNDGRVTLVFDCSTVSPGTGLIEVSFDATSPDGSATYLPLVLSPELEITSGNISPTASISAASSSFTGVSVGFSSTGSTDPDGTITSYAWDFGDGGTSSLASPSHTFSSPGNYNVILTVTDNLGATGSNTHSISIVDGSPIAVIGASGTGTLGVSKGFTGINSTDPNGSIVSYSWDFGDGNTATIASPYHTFTSVGTYPVTLTVTDNHGLTGQTTLNVVVTAINPHAVITGPTSGVRATSISFSSASSTGTITSYAWDFGDGTTSAMANPPHVFNTVGSFLVSLTLSDPDGDISVDTHLISIISDTPVAIITGPSHGVLNQSLGFSSVGSLAPSGAIVSLVWDFGDGGTSTAINPSHTFTSLGVFLVTLSVTDSHGNTANTIHSVTVSELEEIMVGERVPWVFYDPVSGQAYSLRANPQSFKVVKRKKNIAADKTTAGQSVFSEGRSLVPTLSFSGVTLSEDQLETIQLLSSMRHQIRLSDDLGHTYWFYITSLQLSRQLKRQSPWYHTYSIDAVILDWV